MAFALALLAVLIPCSEASEHFTSGPRRVALIELFTSEGCSSCPPADKWLGDQRTKAGLWKDFVPVEFHVNYWDSLGWTDRLSTPEFTAREYSYARAWGKQPYTPCFARNGAPWQPGWGTVEAPGAPVGVLTLDVSDAGDCRAQFSPGPATNGGPFVVHVAVLGGGISSKVTDGENSGRTLEHEFVVLGVADNLLSEAGSPGVQRALVTLPRPIAEGASRHALAAWVTVQGEMEPLQATGGWMP
jgi:hypothetical protein